MDRSEFTSGGVFWCSSRQWRCTDIGTRIIAAIRIRIDSVAVHSTTPEQCRTLTRTQAEAEGWFSGPPYAVAEVVFDEDYMAGCTLEPEPDEVAVGAPPPDTGIADDEWDSPAAKAKQMACATALREPARAGGLRFEAYLPSRLADWLLAHVERGTFRDPSEAVFVILGEHEELELHHDLRQELLSRSLQAAIDDPRPGIPGDVVMERLRARMAAPRPEPAVWPKGRR